MRRDARDVQTELRARLRPAIVDAAAVQPIHTSFRQWRDTQPYQPFFCEENVWQLVRSGGLPAPSEVVFISNANRTVAMWGQRAARIDPVIWDYHVVALLPQHRLVVDLDDRDQVAWRIDAWLAHAFRTQRRRDLEPRFRVVPTTEFLATFSSDRSHMRDVSGRPRHPFPAWAAPFQPHLGMNLQRFIDFDDAIAGYVVDARGLTLER